MGFEGMKNAVFYRWLVLICLIGAGLCIAGFGGFFSYVLAVDVTKLSFIILAAFGAVSGWIGWLTHRATKSYTDLGSILTQLDGAWFAATVFNALGLLGTVIGFTLLMSGSVFAGATAATIPTVILAALSKVGVALTTTLFGIGASLLTKLQAFNLEQWINRGGG
jgi:hypothetical protein